MKRIIHLVCGCCGSPAPALQQWPNQDTGYGCCARCFARIRNRWGKKYVRHCYGKAGVHVLPPLSPTI